jgi:hypothetical protein
VTHGPTTEAQYSGLADRTCFPLDKGDGILLIEDDDYQV